MNPTSLLHWWPVVKDLGIPVPRTEIVEVGPIWAEGLLYGCSTHEADDPEGCGWDDNPAKQKPDCVSLLEQYRPAIMAAAERFGYPVFVRTDLISGKHSWRETCFIPDAASVMRHVWAILEDHALSSFPPPPNEDVRVSGIVVREFLALEAPFTAFLGMPVARERRYFVEDGRVVCHHPYWQDAENIATGLTYGGNDPPTDWRDLLAELNHEPSAEVESLTGAATRVAEALPGAWSVDFAKAAGGAWYLIDMAVAERSWHPEHEVQP